MGLPVQDEGVEALVKAGDRLTLSLHAALAKQESGNLFFSTLSVSMVLGMTLPNPG